MKVLYYTKYSRNGASSRMRSYQYFPFLEAKGIEVTVRPFFDENYLIGLYSRKGIAKRKILGFYLSRFLSLFSIYKYDRIVIEKELFPYFPSWFEKILHLLNIKYIVDYDDAIFHNYDLSTNKLILFLLKNKINNVMKYSGCVVAGNNYLAQRAKDSGAKKIVLLPTVIDIDLYQAKKKYASSTISIGWIGSPSTMKYIKNSTAIFSELLQKYPIELHLIGVSEDLGLGNNVKYLKWTEESETDLISNFDIGVMPLENTPWELGKCSYKLIQYMACGLPVVATDVGMNKEVIENEKNGYLVSNQQEWIEKLSLLIENEYMREKLGKQGRLIVEKKFTKQITRQTLLSLLNNESEF